MWAAGVVVFEMFAGKWIVDNVLDGAAPDDGDEVAVTFGDDLSDPFSLSTADMRAINAVAALHDESKEVCV